MKKQMLVGCVAMAVMACGLRVGAQESAAAGRKILDSAKNSVIKVKVVVQQKMLMNGTEGQSTEETKEVTGTVIDPAGLVVMSLTAVDPSRLMDSIMKRVGGGMKMETRFQIKDVKLILTDGTEVEASIVLRDKDLDLAFVRPTQKLAEPLPTIDLTRQTRPDVLDEVVVVKRLDKVANHEPAAVVSRISAIVRKPRLFYIPQLADGGMEDMGAPVFGMDGNLVGLIVMRIMETSGGGGLTSMFGGAGGMGLTAIVLPAADILESAKQAVEAKVEKPAASAPAEKVP